ncbi:glycosyltransferase family 4 protein [Marinivivus vitaminiproducens]|uniref:glycosyltransferase family 4 protein n=1 Tax=Marinivivus vitaminiproducens TaxID=3035935 RepID=UPI0027A8BCE8|nr:glycosyltransferase family 4 protein [Geminicoccaceae bacterium SCSIO 64248]
MRVAFYAPMKAPDHPVPSGDRRMARQLIAALEHAGHRVELACRLRSYDGRGDTARQARLRAIGGRLAERLTARMERRPSDTRPDLWLTYHAYHKAPDWLGPRLSQALGIPYVLAEAAYAPKQAGGRWAAGHAAMPETVAAADLVFALSARDVGCVSPLMRPSAELRRLVPFLDPAPYSEARANREAVRHALAAIHGLDPAQPWLAVAAMMRTGDKLASYRLLARSLELLADRPWQMAVVGGGPAAAEVKAAFSTIGKGRIAWLGERDTADVADVLAAADLYVWPGVNEAYGIAYLEAQAAGLPVVAMATAGVPEVVADGRSGRLVPLDDCGAFAGAIARLLDDPDERRAVGAAAARHVATVHGFARAVATLDDGLRRARIIHAARAGDGPS